MLDINDIYQIGLVYKRFSRLVQDESLWRILLIYHYGPSMLPSSDTGISYKSGYQQLLKLSICFADYFATAKDMLYYLRAVKTEDRFVTVGLALNIPSNQCLVN
jgi:hypothetical protein